MIKILVFNSRKQGVSLEDYRDYYENVHAPLARSLFPTLGTYRRNYVDLERTHLAETRQGLAPASSSNEANGRFDSISEVFFDSWEAFETFRDRSAEPAVRAQVLADEENFLDPSAIRRFVVLPDGDSAWS